MKRRRRTKLDIFYRILDFISIHGVATKTRIMYRANLGFTQLQGYLTLLLQLELLTQVNVEEKTTYNITEKGKQFLDSYKRLRELTSLKEKEMPEIKASLRL